MLRKVPLIVILGSTGVGKTKLSIELAQKFNGEIISADSMQIYKGLDIVTAKATAEEQAAAPHHMLSIVKPGQPFTVVSFRDTVLPIVEDLLAKSKIPIIVGGTNYYIESLMWKILISSGDRGKSDTEISDDDVTRIPDSILKIIKERNTDPTLDITDKDFYSLPSELLHETLQQLDPAMAARLHPNNIRKIIRALEFYANTNQPLSEIIQEQRNSVGGSTLGGPLRFEHIILFWLRCEQDILNQRLDSRVDSMVAQGMLREIRDFHNEFSSKIQNIDYTKGVLQIIGYKEFIPYLNKYDESYDDLIRNYLNGDGQSTDGKPEGLICLEQCLDELKLVTRRYSKKQKKWISNRFLGNSSRLVPPLYKLDTSDPRNWDDIVYGPAEAIVESYMKGEESPLKPMESLKNDREGLDNEVTKFCEICKRVFVGEYQYKIHMKSNRHKKMIASLCKQKKKEQKA
jgi:tRNA dimethylallyltransferase